MTENVRCRKWQLTFNNPVEHGINHKIINDICKELNCTYWCEADEIGEKQHTPHTHLFIYRFNPVSFDRLKNIFPANPHIEKCNGTCQDNRDYIRKEGRHADKNITSIPDTFEEHGEMPIETKMKNETVSADVLNMLENDCSIIEITHAHPSYVGKTNQLEQYRQLYLAEKYKNEFRNLDVEYIYGDTETGKTRYVMEKFGYENVCKITNYKNPFDIYKGQDVILFDEFRSSLLLNDMLQYLDGYPCSLPARFSDKTACFTKVFIVSNIEFDKQYPNIQNDEPKTWNAWVRRFNRITHFVNSSDLPFETDEPITKISLNPNEFYI